jgi:hypothetical protein
VICQRTTIIPPLGDARGADEVPSVHEGSVIDPTARLLEAAWERPLLRAETLSTAPAGEVADCPGEASGRVPRALARMAMLCVPAQSSARALGLLAAAVFPPVPEFLTSSRSLRLLIDATGVDRVEVTRWARYGVEVSTTGLLSLPLVSCRIQGFPRWLPAVMRSQLQRLDAIAGLPLAVYRFRDLDIWSGDNPTASEVSR